MCRSSMCSARHRPKSSHHCREPVTVVPAFLSRGYHVTTDIPAHVEASGHPDVTVTEALGPEPQLVRVLADRLVESGWRRGRFGDPGRGGYVGSGGAA